MRRVLAVAAYAVAVGTGADAQTYNLFGGPGLIETPTAEAFPDGELGATFAFFDRTSRANVTFQVLPRVSATVRVSTQPEVAMGPRISDEGYDVQFQLLKEGRFTPALALGFRDLLGDGPFGGEYLVATKTVLPGVKLSAGIGWGNLGAAGGFGNVFGLNVRPGPTALGGELQEDTYFQGENAFFGGISWDTPVRGVTLKAEISSAEEIPGDGNDDIGVNFGLTFAPSDRFSVAAYLLDGETFAGTFSLSGNPFKPIGPPDLGTGPVPVLKRADDAPRSTAWVSPENVDKVLTGLGTVLEPDGIVIEAARLTGTTAELEIRNTRIQREPKAIGRVARILAVGLPPSVETFRITLVENGLAITTAVIQRSDLEAQVDKPLAGLENWQTTRLLNARAGLTGEDVWQGTRPPRFFWFFNPTLPINFLDADDGIDPDLQLRLGAGYRLARGLTVSGEISRFLVGFDQIEDDEVPPPTGSLPPVRSNLDAFLSGRDVELERLTADFVFKPRPDLYGRITAGVLERLYHGVSTEVLWAPINSPLSFGAEVNYAALRDFDSLFGTQDFDTVTAFGSVYWDTGYKGFELQLDVGEYLAGDFGGTLSLTRRFNNGWRARAFVTRTEASFADFGEGSFDKGFEVTIPLGWALPFESKSEARLDFLPNENDGGARLKIAGRLNERIRDLDRASLRDQWHAVWQ
ncbi:MAG: YjbH domain-containing protein [Pseudomonadota bacterium]